MREDEGDELRVVVTRLESTWRLRWQGGLSTGLGIWCGRWAGTEGRGQEGLELFPEVVVALQEQGHLLLRRVRVHGHVDEELVERDGDFHVGHVVRVQEPLLDLEHEGVEEGRVWGLWLGVERVEEFGDVVAETEDEVGVVLEQRERVLDHVVLLLVDLPDDVLVKLLQHAYEAHVLLRARVRLHSPQVFHRLGVIRRLANIAQHSQVRERRGRVIRIQAQVSRHEETRTHGRRSCLAPGRDHHRPSGGGGVVVLGFDKFSLNFETAACNVVAAIGRHVKGQCDGTSSGAV
jgi:hypothetical protein